MFNALSLLFVIPIILILVIAIIVVAVNQSKK